MTNELYKEIFDKHNELINDYSTHKTLSLEEYRSKWLDYLQNVNLTEDEWCKEVEKRLDQYLKNREWKRKVNVGGYE